EVALGDAPPLRTGKYVDVLQILRIERYFPPLGVGRQFAPHGGAAPKQQGAAQSVFRFVIQVRIMDQGFKLAAIMIVFAVVELALQEFGNHLMFADPRQLSHAASRVSACGWRRRKGNRTRANIMAIKAICTKITSRSV